MDQAAGLRARATNVSRRRHSTGTSTTLIVAGPERCIDTVRSLLDHWQAEGYRWVGDPEDWHIVPLSPDSPHLSTLASEQPRWAIWVDRDAEAFRRGLATLTRLRQGGAPQRLLAVHHPDVPRRGLLENLRQAAASRLGIDLLVIAR